MSLVILTCRLQRKHKSTEPNCEENQSHKLFYSNLEEGNNAVCLKPLRLEALHELGLEVPLGWGHQMGKEQKPINIKNFGGTPPGVRPVCPGDTSHLSRDMSRLSRGHSVPFVLIYT